MTRRALIIGITGGFGGEVARALQADGWKLRALHRAPKHAMTRMDRDLGSVLEWCPGDGMVAADVASAAVGCQLIVHGANPPGYRNWRGLALPMLVNTIAAAQSSGARILFPGNVYNFHPNSGGMISEDAPQHPVTRKGRIRFEMEELLREAAASGVRTTIVRAGDFFSASADQTVFGQMIVRAGKPVRGITYPGPHDILHSWAYLPDLAATVAKLMARESDLANFDVFHFRGHVPSPGIELANSIRRVLGDETIPIRRFPWFALRLLSPFNEMFRELLEMRYLWDKPIALDNTKLCAFIGPEPHTPLDQAVATTLAGLGCVKNGEGREIAARPGARPVPLA